MKTKYLAKTCGVLLSLALMAAMLTACGGSPTAGTTPPPADTPSTGDTTGTGPVGDPKEIVLGHVYAENHNFNDACKAFKAYVEEASGGSLTVNIQANSVLGGDEEMLEMCADGTVTLMAPSTASLEMYSPTWSIASVPYLYNSAADFYAAMDGALGDYLKSTLEGTEFICLGFDSNGTRSMSNNIRPITQVSDLKGVKMRVMNSATYVKWMNALGANATPMSFGDVFTGLQQGTVDGQENAPSMVWESKFYEVQKYYSITAHIFDANTLIGNRAFYENLNPAEKEIFDYALDKYLVIDQRQADADNEADYIQKIVDSGTEVNYLSDEAKEGFREALAGFYAESKAAVGDDIWAIMEQYQ